MPSSHAPANGKKRKVYRFFQCHLPTSHRQPAKEGRFFCKIGKKRRFAAKFALLPRLSGGELPRSSPKCYLPHPAPTIGKRREVYRLFFQCYLPTVERRQPAKEGRIFCKIGKKRRFAAYFSLLSRLNGGKLPRLSPKYRLPHRAPRLAKRGEIFVKKWFLFRQ